MRAIRRTLAVLALLAGPLVLPAGAQVPRTGLGAMAISHRAEAGTFGPEARWVNLVRWEFPPEWGFPEGGFDVSRCCGADCPSYVPLAAGILPIAAGTQDGFREETGVTEPRTVADGRLSPPAWWLPAWTVKEMVDFLEDMQEKASSGGKLQLPPTADGGDDRFEMEYMDVLGLVAIHPAQAFALGLMLADVEPAEGSLCTYRVVGHWDAYGDRETYVGPIEMGCELPLETPTGLQATLLPEETEGWTNLQKGEAIVPDGGAVAIRWDMPLSPLHLVLPLQPAAWHVSRSPWLAGPGAPAPDLIPGTVFTRLTDAVVTDSDDTVSSTVPAPVIVSPRYTRFGDRQPVLVDGRLVWPRQFYFDDFKDQVGTHDESPLPRYGWYAYEVQGVDVFGRLTEPGDPILVEVKDRTPPPPPMDLVAVVGTPAIAGDAAAPAPGATDKEIRTFEVERARTADGDDGIPAYQTAPLTTQVRLRWRWDDGRDVLAPDLDRFEVYQYSTAEVYQQYPTAEEAEAHILAVLQDFRSMDSWEYVEAVAPDAAVGEDTDPTTGGGRRNYEVVVDLTKTGTACRDVTHFRVVAVDTRGNRSLPTPAVAGFVVDRQAPAAPAGEITLLYVREGRRLRVHALIPGSGSTDVAGYRLYRSRRAPETGAPPADEDLLITANPVDEAPPADALGALAAAGELFVFDEAELHHARAVAEGEIDDLAAGRGWVSTVVDAAAVTDPIHWAAVAVDGCGNASGLYGVHGEQIPDWTPPAPPVVTSAVGAAFPDPSDDDAPPRSGIKLDWRANREPDVVRYQVYRQDGYGPCNALPGTPYVVDGMERWATEPPPPLVGVAWYLWGSPATKRLAACHLRDLDVLPLRTYTYIVRAEDAAGNLSDASVPIQVSAYDLTPPEPATGLAHTIGADGLTVDFFAAEAGLTVWLQRAVTALGPFATVVEAPDLAGDETGGDPPYAYAVTDPDPPDGGTVYYRVILVDASGNYLTDAAVHTVTPGE